MEAFQKVKSGLELGLNGSRPEGEWRRFCCHPGGLPEVRKLAVTSLIPLAITVHVPTPVHAPPQPVNVDPELGAAVSVTVVPTGTVSTQPPPPQLIPAGSEVTDPPPVPLIPMQ